MCRAHPVGRPADLLLEFGAVVFKQLFLARPRRGHSRENVFGSSLRQHGRFADDLLARARS
jgi:hypothetical protein